MSWNDLLSYSESEYLALKVHRLQIVIIFLFKNFLNSQFLNKKILKIEYKVLYNLYKFNKSIKIFIKSTKF